MPHVVEVRSMSGAILCRIPATSDIICGRDLQVRIANETGVCVCRWQLAAGKYRVESSTPIARIQNWMQPSGFMYAIQRNMLANGFNAADLIADGFCFKCMKQAGVKADEILALPRDIDAGALKAAGYSMNELLSARAGLPHLFFTHPLRIARCSTRNYNWQDIRRQIFEMRVMTLESCVILSTCFHLQMRRI